MLITFLFIALLITLIVCFIRALMNQKKLRSIKFAIAFLLVFGLNALFIYVTDKGYSYELSIDKTKLETLCIVDLASTQQYEEWFFPDKRFVPVDDKIDLYMTKTIKIEEGPYNWIDVTLRYYTDEQAAMRGYGISMKYSGEHWGYTTKQVSADYEYAYTDTHCGTDHLFGFLPDGGYGSVVVIRHENIVFRFSEYSNQRESRIGEAIDLLLADYERYKEEMSLP